MKNKILLLLLSFTLMACGTNPGGELVVLDGLPDLSLTISDYALQGTLPSTTAVATKITVDNNPVAVDGLNWSYKVSSVGSYEVKLFVNNNLKVTKTIVIAEK